MTIGLAHALEVRGRLAEAAEHADAAVEGARLWGNDQMLCFALTADAWVSALRGELGRARASGAEAMALLDGLDESVLSARDARARRLRSAGGRRARGLPDRNERGGRARVRGRRARPARVAVRDPRSRRARAGRPAAAADWVARGEAAAAGLGLPYAEAAVLCARAQLDSDGAGTGTARLYSPRPPFAPPSSPIRSARSSRPAGPHTRPPRGGRRGGLPLLERAESELAGCGAVRLRDEAARELRRRGGRPARGGGARRAATGSPG